MMKSITISFSKLFLGVFVKFESKFLQETCCSFIFIIIYSFGKVTKILDKL